MAEDNDRPKLALLIDADNLKPDHADRVLKEAHKLGNPYVKRAYGDWSKPGLARWREICIERGISLEQATEIRAKKNASDMVMVIDALDILSRDNVGAFALVSSDSDFAPLATRLREEGKKVFAIGRSNASQGYQAACTKYIALDEAVSVPLTAKELIERAISEYGTGKSISLSTLGKAARDIVGPSFRLQDYGGKSMTEVVEASKLFIVNGDDKRTVRRR